MLNVLEVFGSIQGEGLHTGLPTAFVRLSGCNLRCTWCDTAYGQEMGKGRDMTVSELMERLKEIDRPYVCITGGEPLLQDEAVELCVRAVEEGYEVDVETNGSIDVRRLVDSSPDVFISMDVKTPSSGEQGSFEKGNLDILRPDDQLKFIVSDRYDIDFALDLITDNEVKCCMVFTPCNNESAAGLLEYLMNGLERDALRPYRRRIRMMLQTHRVIWGPDMKGV